MTPEQLNKDFQKFEQMHAETGKAGVTASRICFVILLATALSLGGFLPMWSAFSVLPILWYCHWLWWKQFRATCKHEDEMVRKAHRDIWPEG